MPMGQTFWAQPWACRPNSLARPGVLEREGAAGSSRGGRPVHGTSSDNRTEWRYVSSKGTTCVYQSKPPDSRRQFVSSTQCSKSPSSPCSSPFFPPAPACPVQCPALAECHAPPWALPGRAMARSIQPTEARAAARTDRTLWRPDWSGAQLQAPGVRAGPGQGTHRQPTPVLPNSCIVAP